MARYIARITLEAYPGEDEVARLLTYCRNSNRPATKELVLDSIEAFYSPFVYESEGESAELVEQKAKNAIALLEAQIAKIRHWFNVPENPALYNHTVITLPQMGISSGIVNAPQIATPSSAVPQLEQSESEPLPSTMMQIDDGEEAREALARFVGDDAQIILEDFPFSFSS